MIVGTFGDIIFQVSSFKVLTFDNYKRTTRHKFAQHEIIRQKPVVESLNSELESVTLTITFNSALNVNPRTAIEKLRQICREARAEYLIVGTEVIGDCRFVIEEISEDIIFWDMLGNPRVSKADMKLLEYSDNRPVIDFRW